MSTIVLREVCKSYRTYRHARDRFLELVTQKPRHRSTVALHPMSAEVARGEVIGIIGLNGAGKSTLLKLIAGTLKPTSGEVSKRGHVCALLELGSGFHPEMSGRDNIFLGGAVAGLSTATVQGLVDDIIEFSGLHEVIDRPVKTYSSGMNMRLAFSVATAVDPDILILDESLSVGDGPFAKKSFERIMGFKDAGKTILFCSHSMYQVQAICSRVMWLDQGQLKMDGDPVRVISSYTDFMSALETQHEQGKELTAAAPATPSAALGAKHRLMKVAVSSDGVTANRLSVKSGQSSVEITITFKTDRHSPPPCLGVMIIGSNGRPVTSASTAIDGVVVDRQSDGGGGLRLKFPHFPLLKGSYWINVFLLCDKGLHVYDKAQMVAELVVSQDTLMQGTVALPHEWIPTASSDSPS